MQQSQLDQATFAGGCFWCTEAIFQRLKGVSSVISGYTGGNTTNPSYEEVCSGTTGHAEAVTITYDPAIIPYQKLLEVFWYTHNPTTVNQQGADHGTQYRSAIFYHNEDQKEAAQAIKLETEQSGQYSGPVVTQIVPFSVFYPAETYHANYYNKNQGAPYCSAVIDPKVKKLIHQYGNDLQEQYQEN